MTANLATAVLLDIDDTLVDTRGAFRHALTEVAAEYLDAGANPEAVLAHWRDDRGGWYRAHTRGEMTHREQRKRRANDLHATFGGPTLDDEAYDIWDAGFERHFRAGWRAFEDAAPLLNALDERGIPYGAVSNADSAYQVLKLSACGLQRVPMLVGVDTFGVGKPDPRVFVEGCRLLAVEPAVTAYVGDEPDLDAGGAARAGLHGVWLDRPGTRRAGHDTAPDGTSRVESLLSVLELLS
ncbi:HAD family hydrolase [Demequina globuliformis]|uniref:HAD family hydrolase n=1 Tax=Demequina globuliformis TaxID=676202 RepID=UPI0007841071|nr:HAD family hydrolase [Demequina globuliformis]